MQKNISLTKHHDDKLVRLAKQLGLSVSETVRRAIDCLDERQADRAAQVPR